MIKIRLLNFILFLIITNSVLAQYVTLDTTFNSAATRVTYKPDLDSMEAIFVIHGLGEVGSDTSDLALYGPHYWMRNGWDGSVALANGIHYPAYITILVPSSYYRPWSLRNVINAILARFPQIKRHGRHAMGLSMGGWEWDIFATYKVDATDYAGYTTFKSIVSIQGMPGADTYNSTLAYPQRFGNLAKVYGTKYLGFEQVNDSRKIYEKTRNMNDSVPGSGFFIWTNVGGGSHCCFNQFYDPSEANWTATHANTVNSKVVSGSPLYSNYIATGQNVYQWALRQGDTTLYAPDTVAVQTQTKITQNVSTNIKGYLQSLPVNYNTDSTKKFPLIISLHGEQEVGSGSAAALDTVAMKGIPKLISDGEFPAVVTLNNGESYSFIVVSPQFNSTSPSNPQNQLNTLLNYLKSNLRVDASRVYIAGLGTGGGLGYTFAVGGTSTTSPGFVDSIAAMVGAGSNTPSMNTVRWNRIVYSNLPHWLTHNNGDPVIPSSRSSSSVNGYNGQTPTPAPLAKLTMFVSSLQDSWTTTYDPAYILDSANSYNVYQWMLQYTNRRIVASAGLHITLIAPDSDTVLDGSKSVARRGRINSYSWSKISGGSATIASSTSAITAISGLSVGNYQFVLTVTHDSSFTASDTVSVAVTNSSPRIAPPVESSGDWESQSSEMLSVKINPTVAYSQVTVVINGRAKGKTNMQISSMDGKRIDVQAFVKNTPSITRTVNVSGLTAGIYLVEIIVNGRYRKVLRFIKR